MTVKATLAYGKNFHFYHEALDNNHVYLELEDVSYDVGYRRVMVAIPIDVWEVIRGLGEARLDIANASDEELIRLVEERVDERIAGYKRVLESDSDKANWLRFSESTKFGSADAPREQQLLRGINYYKTERERQREVATRIAQHKIVDISTEPPEEINGERSL
jgi:hypothetical protein